MIEPSGATTTPNGLAATSDLACTTVGSEPSVAKATTRSSGALVTTMALPDAATAIAVGAVTPPAPAGISLVAVGGIVVVQPVASLGNEPLYCQTPAVSVRADAR